VDEVVVQVESRDFAHPTSSETISRSVIEADKPSLFTSVSRLPFCILIMEAVPGIIATKLCASSIESPILPASEFTET
jgi:hypothetical protein